MLITQKAVEKLSPGAKRLQVVDDKLKGFGVRVEVDGRKSFFWSARIKGVLRFRFLGAYPSNTSDQARTAAETFNGLAAVWKAGGYQGPDPFVKEKPALRSDVPTFSELVEKYIADQVLPHANNPIRAEWDVRWKVKRHFEDWKTRKVDSITVHDMLAVKSECGKHHVLANRAVEFIRTLYNWCSGSEDGKVNFWPVDNPAKGVSLFEEHSRDRFLQPEEMVRFEDELSKEPSQDLKDFLVLSLDTGARKLDLLGARWCDIQWERRVWCIPSTTKNGKPYDAPLDPFSLSILERRRKEIPDSTPWIFPGVGASGHMMDLRKPWIEFRKRARIEDVTVHDLRRTRASYQAVAGQSMQSIARTLGQKNLQSTEVYARLQLQAVIDSKAAGTAKMRELMKEAKKRLKLAAKKPKLLKAVSA